MSEDDPGNESFEEKVRAIAREVSRSVERLADFNVDEIADAIGVDAERARQLADTAARWLNGQAESFGEGGLWGARPDRPTPHRDPRDPRDSATDSDPRDVASDPDPHGSSAGAAPRGERTGAGPRRGSGPHPLDLPTPEQGVALSALDSGRWAVEPGSNSFSSNGEGPDPTEALGLVGELRARDWIDAHGEVTLVGHNALRRWLDEPNPK
jgi:hypothetical protein